MSLAQTERDMYEDFEPRVDSLFFRVGFRGLISFHGKNYNMRKRMSEEEQKKLITDDAFISVASDCYVNLNKVTSMENDCLFFGEKAADSKRIPVSKAKQTILKQILTNKGISSR